MTINKSTLFLVLKIFLGVLLCIIGYFFASKYIFKNDKAEPRKIEENILMTKENNPIILLNKNKVSMLVGDSETLVVTVASSDDNNIDFIWKSENEDIVTVTDGVLTAIDVGETVINVESVDGSLKASCNVIVTDQDNKENDREIVLDTYNLLLNVGSKESIIATLNTDSDELNGLSWNGILGLLNPSNGETSGFKWISDNEQVATVNDGEITAVGVGEAVITVETMDGSLKASCNVIVTNQDIKDNNKKEETKKEEKEEIILDINNLVLKVGSKQSITASLKTGNSSDFKWKSDNESIAKVSAGEITAVGVGETVITVETMDGSLKAICNVIVKEQIIDVSDVKLNKTSINMKTGDSTKLVATINPSNSSNKAVVWESSNTSIAKVDENGVVTALRAGKVVITATSVNGESASCNITIENRIVDVNNVSLNKNSLILNVGTSDKLIANVSPSNATDKSITWISSNNAVAKVNDNGEIIPLSEGSVTITATASNGQVSSCSVNVFEEVYVHFYNPGFKSDAIFVKSGNKAMIIDGGYRSMNGKNNGFIEYIDSLLKKYGIDKIDYYIGTHGHEDHVEIAGKIIKKYNIKEIFVPKGDIPANLENSSNLPYTEKENEKYYNVKYSNYALAKMLESSSKEERLAIESATVHIVDSSSSKFYLGESVFYILNPFDADWPSIMEDYYKRKIDYKAGIISSIGDNPINTNSLVLRMELGSKSFLFAADVSDVERNQQLFTKYPNLFEANVYKNGHHHFTSIASNGKVKDRIRMIFPDYMVMAADDNSVFSTTQAVSTTITKKGNNSRVKEVNTYSVNCGTVVMKTNGETIKVVQGQLYYTDNNKTICANQNN